MSELRKIIHDEYRKTVKNGPWRDELKQALKVHERIPVFFERLVKEFSRPGLNVKRETIELAVKDMTFMFVAAVHRRAEERLMSPLEIALRKSKNSRMSEMNQLADALDKQGEANEEVSETQKGTTYHSTVEI